MLLELRNICRNYGSGQVVVPALRNVNLQVNEGEYIAIMGPSGSGKTTLMNILGCLDRADEGTYSLDGIDISGMDDAKLSDVRLNKIGFVFQTFQLLAGETALENVALPLIYAGVKKAERLAKAEEALKKVGLGERIHFYPNQLSGGQKQRVAIARAMINNPRILLADEPTGALDQASGRQVMELFSQLNEEGTTVIMITHDANVAANARRIMTIVDGRLSEGEAGDSDEE
ncbi:MAG: ABC transporter ATP-binding protein [Erysipelotrichaceae bacterium]|nr:ABC transporter ATP-binding protein [Erysipelotrichaceae bacterium]